MPATALEQMILELVNRARLDPAAEAARDGIDLNEGVPADETISPDSKQPLAMNETLLGTARAHSQDMIDRDYFAHNTPEGVTPFQRMTSAGYNYSTAGENIALTTSSGALTDQSTIALEQLLFVDPNFTDRGHRVNILYGDYQEIGVGQAAGIYQGSNASALTEDFGTRGNQQFLTGVSYADTDHDGFYSIGEGRGSMSVLAGGLTSTGTAGGYSLAVSSGTQVVTFSGGGLALPIIVAVSVTANTNAKVDVIDQGTIATSASLRDLGGATTIIGLGTFGLTLTGDLGDDKFIGTKGNDTIDGAGGTDTVVFSGNLSAYTRTLVANGGIQVAGPDGTDTLYNVEVLQFKDQSVAGNAVPGMVVINDQTLNEGNSGTKVETFTVTRSGGTAAFDVHFATADGSATAADGDYVRTSGTLHFGDGVNTQTISVTINGDIKIEPTEFFQVLLGGPTNGATVADDTGIATIVNDDIAAKDFNGDGKSDILLRSNAGTAVSWDMNDGHVTSTNSISTMPANWQIAGTGDFNGDGKSDILLRSDAGTVVSWDMNDGHVTSTNTISTIPANWQIAGTGDFNGDGKADILLRSDAGTVVSWDMNDGHVTSTNTISTIPANWQIAGTGDFNGDGKSDILLRGNGTVTSWDMNDGQITSTNVISTIPANWQIAGTGDFNGDGKADILLRSAAGTVVSWDMNDGQVTSTNTISTIPANWQIAGTGDFNGDGKADILLRSDAGTVVSWDMNDAHVTSTNVISSIPADWHIIA